jgi:glycosyltransferase involved in cell wall biosynthesis
MRAERDGIVAAGPPGLMADGGRRRSRLLYVVNVDWFFLSHRIPLARAARDAGMQVTIAGGDTGRADEIRAEGIDFVPIPISRKGTGALGEAATFLALLRVYRRIRPDIVHHVTLKPVLYGSLNARLAGGPAVVNAISGLGWVFSSDSGAPLLRRVVEATYRVALGGPRTRTIFQNPEDRDDFVRKELVRLDHTVLIRGSGVDCSRFTVSAEPEGLPVVMLPSRMLWEKGVGQFVEAARELRARGVRARFVLVGKSDEGNPTAVPEQQLDAWTREGVVEWWGHRADMPVVLSEASVVALPSYYKEGLPKVLLEAAAAGRPLVATDIPGCREIVRPGVNGFLVPPRDVAALVDAVQRLLASAQLRRTMGAAARGIAEAEFTEDIVVRQTLDLYRELLGGVPAASAPVEGAA